MKKFDRNEKYKLGVLKQDEDPLSTQPEFSPRKPHPLVLSGQQLSDMGCTSLQDYLSKNPHGFANDKTVHCYKVDEGEYKYFDEGQPIPQPLSDEDPKTMNFYNTGNNKTQEFFERQVKSLESDKKALENKLEQERTKLHAKESEWLDTERKLEKQIVELQTKNDAYKSFIEGAKEGKTLNDNSGGMGSTIMRILEGPIGNAIGTIIAHNEKVQGSVAKLINSAASLVPDEQNDVASQPQQTQTTELNNPVSQI